MFNNGEKKYEDIKGKYGTYTYNPFDEATIKNRSTAIVGTTASGKSFILNEILNKLCDSFYACPILSGTAEIDEMFPMTGYTPRCLIHDKFSIGFLQNVLNQAEKKMKLYRQARNLELLKSAVKVLNHVYYKNRDETTRTKLRTRVKAAVRFENHIKDLLESGEIHKPEQLKMEKQLVNTYRYIMAEGNRYIKKHDIDLSEYDNNHLIPIRLVRFDPHIILVVNDFGDEIKNLTRKEAEVIEQICNKGRHFGITPIFLLQNLKQIPKSVRGSFHNYIFTTNVAVGEYCEVDKTMKKYLNDAVSVIVEPDESLPDKKKNYYRILFNRTHGKIHYTHSNPKGTQTKVGNKRVIPYLEQISSDPLDGISF
jgi:hypothetical protein